VPIAVLIAINIIVAGFSKPVAFVGLVSFGVLLALVVLAVRTGDRGAKLKRNEEKHGPTGGGECEWSRRYLADRGYATCPHCHRPAVEHDP
jgi:hypothetical protein